MQYTLNQLLSKCYPPEGGGLNLKQKQLRCIKNAAYSTRAKANKQIHRVQKKRR